MIVICKLQQHVISRHLSLFNEMKLNVICLCDW